MTHLITTRLAPLAPHGVSPKGVGEGCLECYEVKSEYVSESRDVEGKLGGNWGVRGGSPAKFFLTRTAENTKNFDYDCDCVGYSGTGRENGPWLIQVTTSW